MRKHEVELITALAEGRLADESEARALIESSPKALIAYQDQVAAIEALSKLRDRPEMTGPEKSAMQRDLWTELTAARTAPAAKKGKSATGALGYATAGIFVVAGLFAAMNVLGNSEFLQPASLETLGGSTSATSDSAAEPPEIQVDRNERLAVLSEQARSGSLTYTRSAEADDVVSAASDCLAEAGLDGYRLLGAISESGASYLIVVPPGESFDRTMPIVFVDEATCTVAHRDD